MMTMTLRRILLLIVIINLVILLTTVWLYRQQTRLNIDCQGNLTMENKRGNSTSTLDSLVSIHFTPDGRGDFNLTGNVVTPQGNFSVSRQEGFKWRRIRDTMYEIEIVEVMRYGLDNVPPGIFERYLLGIGLNQKRLVKIKYTPDNGIVIGNLYSPLFICSK